MRETRLQIFRGDAATFDIAAVQRDNVTPQDLTGATVWFTAKHRRGDADVDAPIRKSSPASGVTIVNALGGLARVDLAAGDTAGFTVSTTLYWDVQAKDSGGAVKTLAFGRLHVRLDVTRAT